MGRSESILVSLVLGGLCPILGFLFCWWTAAALVIGGVVPLGERGIAAAAFGGLAVGLVLDAVWLKRWVARFYTARLRIVAAVYLACSVVAVASFMGLPAGNLVLGVLAGVYAARRARHAALDGAAAARFFRRTAGFAAAVTSLEALPIGLLALRDQSVAALLRAELGLRVTAAGPAGVGLVLLACVALAAFQFYASRAAARLTHGWASATPPQPGA